MLDIPRIQAILTKASHWDMYGSKFPGSLLDGSYSHGHLFRPVVSLPELELWEDLMGLTLPEDYRCYLTCLGNGGAGPDYGLFSFKFPLDDRYQKETVYSTGQEKRFHDLAKRCYDEADIDALYQEYCAKTAESERMAFRKFDELQSRIWEREIEKPLYQDGWLDIANAGCSADVGLLLNGSFRGYLGCNSQEYYFENLAPEFSLKRRMKFMDWVPSFAEYYMPYVRQTEEFLNSMSVEAKRQLLREREIILPFQAAVEQDDWKEILHLMRGISVEELSLKSSFFYRYHHKTLQQALPEQPEVEAFYKELERQMRCGCLRYHGFYDPQKKRVMDGDYDAHCGYAVPTFEQFFQTFVDMREE